MAQGPIYPESALHLLDHTLCTYRKPRRLMHTNLAAIIPVYDTSNRAVERGERPGNLLVFVCLAVPLQVPLVGFWQSWATRPEYSMPFQDDTTMRRATLVCEEAWSVLVCRPGVKNAWSSTPLPFFWRALWSTSPLWAKIVPT